MYLYEISLIQKCLRLWGKESKNTGNTYRADLPVRAQANGAAHGLNWIIRCLTLLLEFENQFAPPLVEI